MIKTALLILLTAGVVTAQSTPRRKNIPAIAKDANGAIVSIIMSDKDGHPVAQGSGFLVSKDGRVVTNYHVVRSGSSALVKLPDGAFFVVDGLLAFDKDRDVAVIKAHGENFRTVTLGDSDHLKGASCFAPKKRLIAVSKEIAPFHSLTRIALLHEMIHVKLYNENGDADERHGPRFKAEIRRLIGAGAYEDLL